MIACSISYSDNIYFETIDDAQDYILGMLKSMNLKKEDGLNFKVKDISYSAYQWDMLSYSEKREYIDYEHFEAGLNKGIFQKEQDDLYKKYTERNRDIGKEISDFRAWLKKRGKENEYYEILREVQSKSDSGRVLGEIEVADSEGTLAYREGNEG